MIVVGRGGIWDMACIFHSQVNTSFHVLEASGRCSMHRCALRLPAVDVTTCHGVTNDIIYDNASIVRTAINTYVTHAATDALISYRYASRAAAAACNWWDDVGLYRYRIGLIQVTKVQMPTLTGRVVRWRRRRTPRTSIVRL